MRTNIFKNFTDHVGMIAACVCVFHCVALPLLLITSAFADVGENFHVWSLGLTVLITGHALWHGYKQHCKHIVITFGVIGVACLVAGVGFHSIGHGEPMMEHGEAFATVIGSLFIIAAHFYNIKFKPKCCKK